MTHISTSGYVVGPNKKFEHVAIAERALGRSLPPAAEVHHVNEIKTDNRPANLVICPDRAYHYLLHIRTRALDACGHASWRMCHICREYDDPMNLQFIQTRARHRACHAASEKERLGLARQAGLAAAKQVCEGLAHA